MVWVQGETTNINNIQNKQDHSGTRTHTSAFLSLSLSLFKHPLALVHYPSTTLSTPPHTPHAQQALMTVHYVVMRDRFTEWKMTDNATQTSVSLLRFCDVIPPDKAFYLAGMACRNNKEYESMAFVLLNHYLDISEAIEEGKDDIDCFGGLVEVVFRHSCYYFFYFIFLGWVYFFVRNACVHCAAPSPQATPV